MVSHYLIYIPYFVYFRFQNLPSGCVQTFPRSVFVWHLQFAVLCNLYCMTSPVRQIRNTCIAICSAVGCFWYVFRKKSQSHLVHLFVVMHRPVHWLITTNHKALIFLNIATTMCRPEKKSFKRCCETYLGKYVSKRNSVNVIFKE